ncbi:SDR family NAD(P)-dependent oxidoreductase [Spirillospora sp. CA-294931]|uniref:SDR family NAD(P)-dependent oxidoreductase n=1 Tax=Spirillospora sp. CA-294931 TaxID=3240042 RepID=UPI003D947DCE
MTDLDTAVAVTGLACRFPGAPDADTFWELLAEGREGLTRLTDDQLAERGVPRGLRRDPSYVPVAGLIEGQELFDPEPFGLADAEAALLDPQHRLFLECAWRALERAGHGGGRGAGSVGVFAGSAQSAYLASNLHDRWDPTGGGADPTGSLQTAIATQTDYLPLQTAYRLNLTGPAVALNTTCSTSLVAVHVAAQSLVAGECDTALAGGVSLIVPQGRGFLSVADGIYSRDGRVRAFSAEGSGIVYTQGAGAVVLRRLRDALDDGDPVLAVVHGSAVNNDGAAKAGFTAPSMAGQARVIAEAHAVAGADPRRIGYVEAHGTATRIGDPIEVAALRRVFGESGPAWCGLGSVKSNIGHANAAAGIASFIKTVLAVRHGTLPATLHARPVNELLGLAGSPFEIVTETRPWDGPELAGVSSFGIGGTNAHVIVGPAPDRPAAVPDLRPHPIVLSAHSREALRDTAADLARMVEGDADLAYTLQTGREHFAHRLAVVPGADLGEALRTAVPAGPVTAPPRLVFAFSGGGSARPGMGAALYEAEPVFAACVDECAGLFRELLGHDVRAVILDETGDTARAHGPVHGPPALFAVSLATARLLAAWGVAPHAVLGHSLGECAAAVVAGALPLEDAARLIAVRSTAMARAAGDGAMLAVRLGEDETLALLARHPALDLAAVNAPDACVVSGPHAAIEALEGELRAAGREPSRLRYDVAAHSRLVDPALAAMRKAASGVRAAIPAIPLISTLTGEAVTGEYSTAEYWAAQLREPVRFSRALRTAAGDSALVLQVGPGAALAGLARRHGLSALPCLAAEEGEDDLTALRAAAGHLWAHGVDVDFAAMHHPGRRRVAAPGYAFQRRRLWIDPPPQRARSQEIDEGEPLQVPVWDQAVPLDPPGRLAGRWLVAGPDEAPVAEAMAAAGADAVALKDAGPGPWDGVVTLAHDGVVEEVLARAALAAVLAGNERPPGLLLHVTRSAQRVESSDRPDPAVAASLALPRVLAQEHPGLRWRTLDLDARTPLVPAVLAEAAAARDSGAEVALRGGVRWVRDIRAWRPAPDGERPFRAGDIALITGGLGEVGRAVAAHLTRQGLRVVVTSRGRTDDGLDVRRVDAADPAATTALLAELAGEAPVALVVHAAGVVGTADLEPLRRVGEPHVTGHVAAKIEGALALRAAIDALPAGRRPSTVVLMSSAGTLVGGIGTGPYCAANRYLDALAEARAFDREPGTRWVSVLWDAWAARDAEIRPAHALDVSTGLAALDRVLASRRSGALPPVVAVSATDLRERRAAASYSRPGRASSATGLEPAERAVADVWTDLLGTPVSSADDDFFALGGHSLLATRMLARLRESHGAEIRLRDLLLRPTVGGLAELLAAHTGQVAPEPVPEPARTSPDGTFAMTRVQHAYWVGRGGGYALGDIPCHFYLEYDCPDLDLTRYEAAWRAVIDRHPMLRTIVTGNGRLRTLDRVPPYRIRVHDLSGASEEERDERLSRLRARVSRDPGPPDRWPLVQIQAARLPEGRVRLFLGVDVLICDAGSYWIIDRDLRHFYRDPGTPLPEIGIDFAACVQAMETGRDGAEWKRAAAYWRDRLDTLPGPPPLPVSEPTGRPRFVRRSARLRPTEWEALRTEAARRGATPTAVFLAAYAEALAGWSGSPHFSMTLTLFDRPAIHPGVDSVVGDFTSLLVHEVDRREPGSFADHVRAAHRRLFADLDHRAYSALDLFGERAARTGELGAVPVVFTSALGLEDLVGGEADLQWVGEQVHALSQTPQTWLDHQVLVQRGELLVQWDAVDGVLPAAEVDRVFAQYVARLRCLAADPAAWDGAATQDALVPLRDGTGDETLYLLHPSGGDVMCYAELSRLLDERFAVVAVTDPGLVDGDASEDLTELARSYAEAIRRRSAGPYLLGGWSMGGSLGQEVARLLTERGESVRLLLMVDSNDPTHITAIQAPTPEAAEAEAARRLLGEDAVPGPRDREKVAVFARHLRGLADHVPRRLDDKDVTTLLIRAGRRSSRNSGIGMGVDDTPPGVPALGWEPHLAGPIEDHAVDADHYTLLRPPAVARVAELINATLRRLRPKNGTP